jgi:hypothetical protein
MPREGEVEVHPRQLLGQDLLQRGRTAADETLLVQLGKRFGTRLPAPDIEGAQLDLGHRVVTQQQELPALQGASVSVGQVAGHHLHALVPEGQNLPSPGSCCRLQALAQRAVQGTLQGGEIGVEEGQLHDAELRHVACQVV